MPKLKKTQAQKSTNTNSGHNQDGSLPSLETGDETAATEISVTEPIWGYSNLKRDVFYASLAFFDANRPTQLTEYVVPKSGAVRSSESNNTTKLLDQIALLFARFKNSTLPPKSASYGLYPSSTGQNVTAAALQKPQDQPWTIHITKNDGPLIFDQWSDKELCAKLGAWYDALGTDNGLLPAPQKEIWHVLQGFWLRRTSYYFDRLKEIRVKLINELEDTSFRELLVDVYAQAGSEDLDSYAPTAESPFKLSREKKRRVEVDIGHVKNLLVGLDFKDSSEEAVNAYVYHIWFEDDLPWGRKYSKIDASDLDPENNSENINTTKKVKKEFKSQVDRVNHFRSAVKYLSLTRTPKSVLERLVQFKKENPRVRLTFNFVDAEPVLPIRAQSIVTALNSPQLLGETQRSKEFKKDLNRATISLVNEDEAREYKGTDGEVRHKKPAGIHRYFHCEMQLLDKFLYATDVYEYFGCSKLSCYLCWCVLVGSGTPYRTNYTHRKIGLNSAFPFRYSADRDEKFRGLADAPKNIQDHLSQYIANKARLANKEYYLTNNSGASDTYIEYTTSMEPEHSRDTETSTSDDAPDRENWTLLAATLRETAFDPASPLFSALEQQVYNVVRIPQSGAPALVPVTAYNMQHWGQHDVRLWGKLPVTHEGQKLWYPGYLFQPFNPAFSKKWFGHGWERLALVNNFYADVFHMEPHDFEKYAELGETGNGWWRRENGYAGLTYRVMIHIYVGRLDGGEQELTTADLEMAVQALRAYAVEIREKRRELERRNRVVGSGSSS